MPGFLVPVRRSSARGNLPVVSGRLTDNEVFDRDLSVGKFKLVVFVLVGGIGGLCVRQPRRHAIDSAVLEGDSVVLPLLASAVVIEEPEDGLHDRVVGDQTLE